jgi:hypothetical protein
LRVPCITQPLSLGECCISFLATYGSCTAYNIPLCCCLLWTVREQLAAEGSGGLPKQMVDELQQVWGIECPPGKFQIWEQLTICKRKQTQTQIDVVQCKECLQVFGIGPKPYNSI